MFMELNRVKDDLVHIKVKTGITSNNTGLMNNDLSNNGGPSKMLGSTIA